MASFHSAHFDAGDLIDGSADESRFNDLNARSVGPEAPVPDDQRQRHGINAQNQRPLLSDHMEETIDSFGLDRGKDGGVDRRDCSGMSAGEGNEILIGLL